MPRQTPQNIDQVRKFAIDEMTRLRDGVSNAETAKAMGNLAGKVVAASALEYDYQKSRGGVIHIPFLEVDYAETGVA